MKKKAGQRLENNEKKPKKTQKNRIGFLTERKHFQIFMFGF